MTVAEQTFVNRITAELLKILPPVPAGWAEVERRDYDAGGMTSEGVEPIQVDYELQLVSKDIEARQKIVEERQQAMIEKNRAALDAQTAKNEKLMEDFSAKLQAAIAKNDQALVDRLQADFQKRMAAGAQGPPTVASPELSDTYARIHISINPFNSSALTIAKKIPVPVGFTAVGRSEPSEATSDREGVTSYLIGHWQPDQSSGYTLKFTPNKGTVVYGVSIAIEARADRSDALFKTMNIARLKALLQP
jgi:hypothetical protein